MLEKNKKSGSAILLALMIVSAILSSALYINVLSIRGMKQSQNIDNSIVAFYAAETGNEQAIYYIRKVENLDINDLILPSVSSNSITASESLVSRKILDEVKNTLISLEKDETYQLDLFDQEDLNAKSFIHHLELSWDGDCAVPKIELTVNEWTAGENVSWGEMQDQMHISKCLMDPSSEIIEIDNSGRICTDVKLDGSMSYQFRFKALNCDIYNLSIKAFNVNEEQIAFKNVYSIESVGEYPVNTSQSNKQALHVNLRKFSPLSGLFDYVLFSEKSLVKDSGAYTGGWFGDELFISTNNLPEATVGVEYLHVIQAVNGEPPYSWTLSGSFPQGSLTIDEDSGVLSGEFSTSGNYPLMIRVVDNDNPLNASDSKTLFLKVNE